MRKRIILSLLLLLFMATVFAATVRVTVNVSQNANRYSVRVTSIPNGVALYYSLTDEHSTNILAAVGDTIATNRPRDSKIWFRATDTNTSEVVSLTLNSTGDKTLTLTTSDKNGLAEEARLYYFPRSVVDNSNVMVNLNNAKSMTTVDFNESFVNYSDENLAVFRIREDLMSETVGTGQVGTEDESITITIESLDGWTFVNEYNSTRTTSFTLDAFCLEQELTYISNPKQTYYTTYATQKLGSSTVMSRSGDSATFEKVGDHYELVLPYTYFQKGSGRYYPRYIRDSDICLNIPEFGTGMEPGYYTTRLRVTIPDHYEAEVNERETYGFGSSFVITIRGYLGIDADSSGSSSFFVLSTDQTYSMDLGISTNPQGGYAIAEAKFRFINVVSGRDGQSGDDPRPRNPETKYTIYISSTSDYTDTTTPFKFVKIGSEHQARTDDNTIYFRLGWDSTNASYDKQTGGQYYMRPTYTAKQISKVSSGNTGRNSYQLNWEMDNILKLYLTDQSLQTNAYHQEGMYYSYIYFTLVTND